MREIPGYKGYFATENGDIIGRKGWVLKPAIKKGYYQVNMYVDSRSKVMKTVHGLVASAFLGERPANTEVDHIDGNKLNNAPSNLQYISHGENVIKIVSYPTRHETYMARENHHIYRQSSGYLIRYRYKNKAHMKFYTKYSDAIANRDRLLAEWGIDEVYPTT